MEQQNDKIVDIDELKQYAKKLNYTSHFSESTFSKKLLAQSVNSFLLTMYKFDQVLDEWSMYLGALIAKVQSSKERVVLGKIIIEYNQEPSYQTLYENYLRLFDDKKILGTSYYTKYSLAVPYEKFCGEFVDLLTSTYDWRYIIGAMIMIQYINLWAGNKIIEYTKKHIDESKCSDTFFTTFTMSCENQVISLMSILVGHDRALVFDGMVRGHKLILDMYDSISKLFD